MNNIVEIVHWVLLDPFPTEYNGKFSIYGNKGRFLNKNNEYIQIDMYNKDAYGDICFNSPREAISNLKKFFNVKQFYRDERKIHYKFKILDKK